MTELGFLIELLLEHELGKETKTLIAARIKEVEQGLVAKPILLAQNYVPHAIVNDVPSVPQAASTIAAMQRHASMGLAETPSPMPVPAEQIAQTPQAVAAMNSRNAAISASLSGKVDKETGRPRKF